MTPPLHSSAVLRALLARHGVRADKGFGQNFLVDARVLGDILGAAAVGPKDTVLEVGPGPGVLTAALAERAGRVIAVELDARMLAVLAETVGDRPNVEVVAGDALRYDWDGLPPGSLLVANLPYNVATAVLVRALESGRFSRLVVMVQKEVAERLASPPGSKAYGALTLVVAHFARVERVRDVGPSAFLPPPAVTSSVVRLTPAPGVRSDPELLRLVHDGFRHRRKTLRKNLRLAGYDEARAAEVLMRLGLPPQVRAEALGLEQFRALRDALGTLPGSPGGAGQPTDP